MRLAVRVWIVFSLIVSAAFATIFGRVGGTISDAQQHPIPEARVVLTARNSQWQQTKQTDSAGTFAFQGVPLGDYTLRAEARGVAARRREIGVASGAVVPADLALPLGTPRDVDYLEIQRGGYSAEYGERTYGIFNVVPRSGFERNNEAHVLLNYGSFHSTDDQLNFGGHTERFAYYTSMNGNRTGHGLETPIPATLHDAPSGAGAFASFIFLPNPADQLRLVAAARADRYDIPNDEDLEATGIRDRQRESDLFLNATWLRTMSASSLLSVAPFFHTNSANFDGGQHDPIITRDHRRSRYLGAAVAWTTTQHGNDIRAGAFGFDQLDSVSFSLQGDGATLSQRTSPSATVASLFLEDRYDITSRLTVRGGIRYTRFEGGLRKSAITPRAAVSLQLGANVVVRASYSDVYQPPPLSTVAGPLLQFALSRGFDFLPLHGERGHQADGGLAVAAAGWVSDLDQLRPPSAQ